MFISNSERRNAMGEGQQEGYEQPMRDVVFTAATQGGERQRVFVIPSTIHLGGPKPLKTIRWQNNTEKPVHVWLASVQGILKSNKDLSQPVRIDPGKDLVVSVQDCKGEWQHDYHVYCEEIGNYADGNSPPHMSCP
jgi:hypothetical protein